MSNSTLGKDQYDIKSGVSILQVKSSDVRDLPDTKWGKLASKSQIEKTIKALGKNNIEAMYVAKAEDARELALSMIPEGAEVMDMTSRTLESLGLDSEIRDSGKYDSVKSKLMTMKRETQGVEMQKLGAAAEWSIESVHAVTEEGKVVVASNSGSQMPGYVYGSAHVVWVVGAQKLVKNLEEAIERLYDYTLPLESERLKGIYGIPSFVSKLLIFNREPTPDRIKMIIVGENLGF